MTSTSTTTTTILGTSGGVGPQLMFRHRNARPQPARTTHRSMAIPMPSNSSTRRGCSNATNLGDPTEVTTDDRSTTSTLRRNTSSEILYDLATWRMYARIVEYRQQHPISAAAVAVVDNSGPEAAMVVVESSIDGGCYNSTFHRCLSTDSFGSSTQGAAAGGGSSSPVKKQHPQQQRNQMSRIPSSKRSYLDLTSMTTGLFSSPSARNVSFGDSCCSSSNEEYEYGEIFQLDF